MRPIWWDLLSIVSSDQLYSDPLFWETFCPSRKKEIPSWRERHHLSFLSFLFFSTSLPSSSPHQQRFFFSVEKKLSFEPTFVSVQKKKKETNEGGFRRHQNRTNLVGRQKLWRKAVAKRSKPNHQGEYAIWKLFRNTCTFLCIFAQHFCIGAQSEVY